MFQVALVRAVMAVPGHCAGVPYAFRSLHVQLLSFTWRFSLLDSLPIISELTILVVPLSDVCS